MAKTVQDLLVELEVKGVEGVHALKSSLRALSKSVGPVDKGIQELRKSIVDFAKSGQNSRQSIIGQIDAFKGLRQQATIGSTVYKRLGKDIDSLTDSLDKLNRKEEETGRKRAPGQIAGEFTSAIPEKTSRQIQAQQEMLRKSAVSSDEYTTKLIRLNAVTQEFTRSQQRQVVLANNVVAMNKAAAAAAVSSKKIDIDRTFTTAALKQKVAELAQDLDNLDVGSKEYTTTSNRLKEAQEELNVVLGISNKAFDDLSRAQERATRRAQKLADIQAAQAGQVGTRDPGTGAMIARGSAVASLVQQPVREVSGLYRSISDIGMSGIAADIDRMGRSYQGVATDIKQATKASNNSINSLQAQRASWAALRAGLEPTSKAYREVSDQIERVDRRLERLNRRSRPTLRGAAQSLGGIAAGGIFGGPEGAIGGLLGAPFGVGGVAAGAALGAQAGMLRQSIGNMADYASTIKKLKIALDGVLKDQDDFNFAIQTASKVTAELNIPQQQSIRGITKLSAAVKGAGGPVQDAALTFKNISAAIKATGGSAQDVDSAITAMVQVFSKGKVSAEELSGQLGERLPGAVTMFAEANKMTLPELQKNLKAGTVGLNELMNFIIELGIKFDGTAKDISKSNADAGARLAVVIQEMQAKVGAALLPIGAQFQDAFGEFIKTITPALVKILPRIGQFLLDLVKNLDKVAAAAVIVLKVLAVGKIMAVVGSIKSLSLAKFALFRRVVTLKKAVAGLNTLLLSNPYAIAAAGAALLADKIFNASREQNRLNNLIKKGSTAQLQARLGELGAERDRLLSQQLQGGGPLSGVTDLLVRGGVEQSERGVQILLDRNMREREALEKRLRLITDLRPDQGADLDLSAFSGFDYAGLNAEGAKDASKGPKAMMSEIELALRRQLRGAIEAENQVLQANLQLALDMTAARQETEDANKRINMEEEAQAKFAATIKNINEKAQEDELKRLREKQKLDSQLQQSLATRKLELGLITQEEFNQLEIQRERARLEGMRDKGITTEQIEEQMKVFKQLLNQTPIDKFVKQAKDSLNDLQTVAVNVAQGIGDAVGNALTNGINSLIEGTKNAKEVFADFLKSVGQMLAQEGAKMIATYIAIGVAKAFAGLAGGSDKAINPESLKAMEQYSGASANFDAGSFATAFGGRAGGGPVNAGRPYMVGERGPELFVPGQSGGIMRNEEMRRLMGRSPAGAGAGAAAMNFTFETTNIGGTEYVSREQLESAMATTRRQAANDGARRGMSMMLDKMQNSPRTRSRIGIS